MFKILGTAVTASLFAITPAFAGQNEVPTRLVKTADLNLGSDEGRAALDLRIRSAARSICYSGNTLHLSAKMAEKRCFQNAIDGTRPQVALLLAAAGQQVAAANVESQRQQN